MPPEIAYPITLLVIIIGTYLCLTLGMFLFSNKSSKNNANLFLVGLILVFFAFFLQAFLYRFHLLETFPYFIGFGSPALFLLGPFAYFYIRASTQKGFRLRPIDGLHFLPFLLNFVKDIPRFLQRGEARIADYLAFVNTGDYPGQGDLELLIKSLHGIVYFIIGMRFILLYRKNLSNETSSIDTSFHRWMLLFIILLAFPVSSIFFYIHAEYNQIFIPLQLSSFFLLLVAIHIATLVKPELFRTFPHQMPIPKSSEERKQKYENSNLVDKKKELYLQRLETYVQTYQPYLEPELTRDQLSEKVKIPPYYLSQVINERLDCNFLDYINSYRIEAAKAKLVDPKLSNYTIAAIAYDVGFNATSTFYAVFKKQTGMTPRQYQKQHVA